MKALRATGYAGSLVYTICGPVHRGPDELALAPLEDIDDLVEHAIGYMKEIASAA